LAGVFAKEDGGSKKQVSNAIALSLVEQLFRLGAIDPARAPGTKKQAQQVSLA